MNTNKPFTVDLVCFREDGRPLSGQNKHYATQQEAELAFNQIISQIKAEPKIVDLHTTCMVTLNQNGVELKHQTIKG